MALLLTPREREAERQKSQEKLAREATALGSKVDELRELEQSSKKRLQDFQEKEFAKFQEQQDERKEQLAKIDGQIDRRKKELERLLAPLDEQFALYVKTERGNIEAEQARQAEFSAQLDSRDRQQVLKSEEQAKKEVELKQETSRIAALRDSVEKDKGESVRILASATEQAQSIVDAAKEAKKDADNVRIKAKMVLREAELKQEAQDTREKELEKRELAVIVKELQFYSPVKPPLQTKN